MFENEIFYFSVVLVSLLLILFLLFSYLVIKKLIGNDRRAKVEKYKEDYRLSLFQYFQDEANEESLSFRSQLEVKAFIELTAGFAKVLGGYTINERIRVFAETHFESYIYSRLTHRRWSMRMNALYWIEEFDMKNMFVHLDRLFASKKLTKSEEIQLLKIYILNENHNILEKMISPRHALTEFDYSLLFKSLNGRQLDRFIQMFDELPMEIRYALVDSIGLRGRQADSLFLESLLDNQAGEIRIRALKAIVEMEHFLAPSKLTQHLLSSSWQERLMAIKACEYIRSPELVQYLEDLMSDSSFYVRSQAAQSLLRLASGKEVLSEIAASAEDAFARDMAAQWLERGAV
ncbi:HEAT repeat domain-containing protein [Bacillus sp. Marseille-Q1617]|uniref:HEAT repeat domain-containing protein n=1 Tax=Bacillus sp. Marseille-Q1617 TaxID=2736887 RepID=UPI00158CDE4C|nr:HEAT repeat domain-containing protein [Bacillus sp. Marseille-Q1617]